MIDLNLPHDQLELPPIELNLPHDELEVPVIDLNLPHDRLEVRGVHPRMRAAVLEW